MIKVKNKNKRLNPMTSTTPNSHSCSREKDSEKKISTDLAIKTNLGRSEIRTWRFIHVWDLGMGGMRSWASLDGRLPPHKRALFAKCTLPARDASLNGIEKKKSKSK